MRALAILLIFGLLGLDSTAARADDLLQVRAVPLVEQDLVGHAGTSLDAPLDPLDSERLEAIVWSGIGTTWRKIVPPGAADLESASWNAIINMNARTTLPGSSPLGR